MAYERCVADLEGGIAGYAFASGLAAGATILDMLDQGSHVIAMDDLYGGTYRLFERVRRRSAGHDFTFVDLSDLAALQAAIRPETKLIWLETPTNRSEEHTSELQSLMRISYAAFCFKKKNTPTIH